MQRLDLLFAVAMLGLRTAQRRGSYFECASLRSSARISAQKTAKSGSEHGALAILAIEKVTHRVPASFVESLALVGVHGLLRCRIGVFGFAARGAPVSKAGLTRLQFELIRANGADLDRKCHAK